MNCEKHQGQPAHSEHSDIGRTFRHLLRVKGIKYARAMFCEKMA